MFNAEKTKSIFELQTQYDVEKKNGQIALLSERNKYIEAQRLLFQKNNELLEQQNELVSSERNKAILKNNLLTKQKDLADARNQLMNVKNQSILKENEIVKKRNQVYLILTVLLLSVLILLFWLLFKFQRTKQKLSKLNTTKDRLFAIIAHDLRGPALSFQGLSSKIAYLIKNNQPERIAILGDAINLSAQNLSQLTDNLLQWALNQKDMISIVYKQYLVKDLINLQITYFGDILSAKMIKLHYDSEDSSTIYADKDTVLIIIRNLISNAIKFTPVGGEIWIKTEMERGKTTIHIIDSGIGISENKLKNLFTLDKEKQQRGTNGEKGAGVGLILCQEFALLNNGKITISNNKSQVGSIASLILCS